MLISSVERLLGILLAAGGPQAFPPRMVWPMHQALKELGDEAGRRGLESALPDLRFTPSPDVGWKAEGADKGLIALRREQVLRVVGLGRDSELRVDPSHLVPYRRDLMRLEPAVTQLLQRTGRSWAALAETSAKICSTPPRSSAATLRRATPN